MCGRYAFSRVDKQLLERLALEQDDWPEGLEPRWNIAPGQSAAALRLLPQGRRLDLLHWGFPRSGASPGALLINARAETAATLPSFREAFAGRRCLLPCDGWYEWKRGGRLRSPWFIHPASGETALLAGLWQGRIQGGESAFVLLTCAAAESIAEIHPRMPVILPPALWADWLAGSGEGADWAPLLRPWPAADLQAWEVGPEVNGTTLDRPGLIAPVDAVQGCLF